MGSKNDNSFSLSYICRESSLAQGVIQPHLRKTPCRLSEDFSEQLGFELYLKLENLQRTGSFKTRGSMYAISKLKKEQRESGVVTASAGNHAQGVAFAAKQLGIYSLVVMPEYTPNTKLDAVKALGSEVELYGSTFDDAYARAEEYKSSKGLVMIHPFDDSDVIAGQGTVALEILEQVPDVETIIVSVGGGGLISGVISVVKTLRPDIRVVGVVADGVPSLKESMKTGSSVEVSSISTIADGIAVKKIGENCFSIIQENADDIVSVSDDSMASAILSLLEEERMLAEAAGAAPLASLFDKKVKGTGKTVALICGGNLDVNLLSRIIGKGLALNNRYAKLQVPLHDVPGALTKLSRIVSEERVNIIHIEHDRFSTQVPINHTLSRLYLEVRGNDHLEFLVKRLISENYEVIRENN